MRLAKIRKTLEEVIKTAQMEGFGSMSLTPEQNKIDETRLWRGSWIISPLKDILTQVKTEQTKRIKKQKAVSNG